MTSSPLRMAARSAPRSAWRSASHRKPVSPSRWRTARSPASTTSTDRAWAMAGASSPSTARRGNLLDDAVGLHRHNLRDRPAELLGGAGVDNELERGRLLDRQIGGLCSFQDAVEVISGPPHQRR